MEDGILGMPDGWELYVDGTMLEGYRIENYITDNGYWKPSARQIQQKKEMHNEPTGNQIL